MNRIRQLRIENGWTQDELGEKLNVKRSAISKYESGRIPLTDDTIKKLVQIFDKSSDYILGLDDEKNIKIHDVINLQNICEEAPDHVISNISFFTNNDGTSIDGYFPLKLTYLREEKGLTKEELAKVFGGSVNGIEALEEGILIPSNNFLKKLSVFFDVPIYTFNSPGNVIDVEKEAEKMIENINTLNIKFCGNDADEEDKEYLKLTYERLLSDIRLYNRQKHMLKKYSNPTIDEEVEAYRKELEAEQKAKTLSASEGQNEESKKKNA